MTSNAVVTMDDMQKAAVSLVKSKLFGFDTVDQAMAVMMIAQAEGRHPALAARDYHVIQGRPALKADAMLARFQQEGGIVEWSEYTEDKVTGLFSHPKSCPKPVAITWTMEMAKRIGLANKDNWRKYQRQMLRSRVISEGVRTVHPGIAVGVYTIEEEEDFAKERDITPTAGAGDVLGEEQRTKVTEIADKVREWLNSGSLVDARAEMDNSGMDAEETIFFWTHFDARIRRQLKEEGERQRIKASSKAVEATITEAQKKRLEAIIGEKKLNRDDVKAEILERWGREHFADLTRDEYEQLCSELEKEHAPQQILDGASVEGSSRPTKSADGAAPDDATIISDIEKLVKRKGFEMAYDMCRGIKDETLRESTSARITKAKEYVEAKT